MPEESSRRNCFRVRLMVFKYFPNPNKITFVTYSILNFQHKFKRTFNLSSFFYFMAKEFLLYKYLHLLYFHFLKSQFPTHHVFGALEGEEDCHHQFYYPLTQLAFVPRNWGSVYFQPLMLSVNPPIPVLLKNF